MRYILFFLTLIFSTQEIVCLKPSQQIDDQSDWAEIRNNIRNIWLVLTGRRKIKENIERYEELQKIAESRKTRIESQRKAFEKKFNELIKENTQNVSELKSLTKPVYLPDIFISQKEIEARLKRVDGSTLHFKLSPSPYLYLFTAEALSPVPESSPS